MTTLVVSGGGALGGMVVVPGDKSISHRALMLGALADGTSVVRGLSRGDDVGRTRAAMGALGAVVEGDTVRGGPDRLGEAGDVIDVGNSGTTMRLMAGLCAPFPWLTVLTGDESIRRRPMDRVAEPLRLMGVAIHTRAGGRAPLAVGGGALTGIDYPLVVASAQVKSAILLAGLGADGETVVRERVRTRAHTEEMLALAGADVAVSADGLVTSVRRSRLRPFEIDVPGDPSQAAFWVVAGAIVAGADLELGPIYQGPARSGFVDVLRRMGADVRATDGGGVAVRHRGVLGATAVDGSEIPSLDEVPALAVAAALAEGTTVFSNVGELRVKESDRIATMAEGLGALGVEVGIGADGRSLAVTGTGGKPLRGGATVSAHGDHRVAMALAVAALAADGDTTIDGWDSVATSYPGFEEQLQSCRS